jgi:hypothetical protein
MSLPFITIFSASIFEILLSGLNAEFFAKYPTVLQASAYLHPQSPAFRSE